MKRFKGDSRLAARKILVADDDEAFRELLTSVFTYAGAEVIEAVDGEDCILKARLENPDLIILDIFMPKINGIEAYVSLKSSPDIRPFPVIMISSDHSVLAELHNSSFCVDGYLYKPFSAFELLEKTVNIISKYEVRC